MKQTGAFLKAVRKSKGLTQDEFAKTIRVSHATLSALENGKGVSTKTFEKALNFLGLRLVIVQKSTEVVVTEATPSTGEAEVTETTLSAGELEVLEKMPSAKKVQETERTSSAREADNG